MAMLTRFCTRFSPNIPFKSNEGSIIKPKAYTWSLQEVESSYTNQHRSFAEKRDKGKESGKEEVAAVKMPGLVHPETKSEEGYFTEKAKQQLDALKRNPNKPIVTNPEKKE